MKSFNEVTEEQRQRVLESMAEQVGGPRPEEEPGEVAEPVCVCGENGGHPIACPVHAEAARRTLPIFASESEGK